jgi:hypothetical protein
LTFLTWNATGTLVTLVAATAGGEKKATAKAAAAPAVASNEKTFAVRKLLLIDDLSRSLGHYLPTGR